ncbi:CDP-alcohol phosphatidyltransferase [Purpureocillium lavendulum]|uniref:CDP-alcohol phosphatidyltransferase n=1 Tax=Purpureocillium lavendulum TaxID=1247861 RepID=A0AB34FQ82_9HYPO|nr:CDP-alcohol phosphatidyltransferase [Purpureocillium lavendulum]
MLSRSVSRLGSGLHGAPLHGVLSRRAALSTTLATSWLRPPNPVRRSQVHATWRSYSSKRPPSHPPALKPPPAVRQESESEPKDAADGRSAVRADVVHEDIYTIPNFLTLTRLVAAPVIGYLVLQDAHAWAVGLFVYAGVTDLLDGWIARRWDRKTVVGTVIDPMADKALMTILTVCLAVKGALPLGATQVWVATIILGRDVGLGIAAIYYRWISLPPPKTFARYWDFSLPSAEVRPTTISKYNTFLQLALVGLTTAAPLVSTDMMPVLTLLQ